MSPIDIFFRDCVAGLKRIAAATRGDASLDDVKNEAWVMAHDLARRGNPLNLTSPADQHSMLGKLYGKFVLPMRTCIGFALRLDKDWDQSCDDAGPCLHDKLKGPEAADPLHALEQKEAPTLLEMSRRCSYSQATAYAICLAEWPDLNSLAVYLAIKLETLNARLRHWRAWVVIQPSLFDGIEQIDLDFVPLRGNTAASSTDVNFEERQLAWGF